MCNEFALSALNGAFGCLTVGPESLFNGFTSTIIIYITADAVPNARKVDPILHRVVVLLLPVRSQYPNNPCNYCGMSRHNTGMI